MSLSDHQVHLTRPDRQYHAAGRPVTTELEVFVRQSGTNCLSVTLFSPRVNSSHWFHCHTPLCVGVSLYLWYSFLSRVAYSYNNLPTHSLDKRSAYFVNDTPTPLVVGSWTNGQHY